MYKKPSCFSPQESPLSVSSALRILFKTEEERNMGEEKPKSPGVWPTVKPFVNGGASGMLATCVIQPIDMIKVLVCC